MISQIFNAGTIKNLGAIYPLYMQRALHHMAVDTQQMGLFTLQAMLGAFRFTGQFKPGIVVQHGIELAQVVEHHICFGCRSKRLTHLLIVRQIFQCAEAETTIGNGAQVFLDTFQINVHRQRRIITQPHRIHRREPAYGATQIHPLIKHLAAMTFEVDQQLAMA